MRKVDNSNEPILREHSFDGIQEFDQRLPNWWLVTLFGAIIFAAIYWFFFFQSGVAKTEQEKIRAEMQRIEAAKLSAAGAALDDDTLWKMSRNPQFVTAGQTTFLSTCASCHGKNLEGGIGFNLADEDWVHGSKPTQIVKTVADGVPAKGMPTWGPILGPRKISEVVAFVLSKHDPEHMRDAPAGAK